MVSECSEAENRDLVTSVNKIEVPRNIHYDRHKQSHSADVSIRFCVLCIKQFNCTLRNQMVQLGIATFAF